jgi:hypothetical protein
MEKVRDTALRATSLTPNTYSTPPHSGPPTYYNIRTTHHIAVTTVLRSWRWAKDCPKHVELLQRSIKLLLLHLVGHLYYSPIYFQIVDGYLNSDDDDALFPLNVLEPIPYNSHVRRNSFPTVADTLSGGLHKEQVTATSNFLLRI